MELISNLHLQRQLRVEKDSPKREIKDNQQTENYSKVNSVEESKTQSFLKSRNDAQFMKKTLNKKHKMKDNCYFCKKPCHYARDYRQRKKQNKKRSECRR